MGLASEQAARHCWQMDRVWRGEITQGERDREARFYADKLILLNRLIGLGGLGQWVGVVRVLWGLVVLFVKRGLGYA